MSADPSTVEVLVAARRDGLTLRQAAAKVGVHVATVCRWQAADPELYRALRDAARQARIGHYRLERFLWKPRPRVPWRQDCPLCQAEVVVRTAPGKLTFWRCGRRPVCKWASWRPRAPRDCKSCGGTCYWSHSRKSVACGDCGVRIMTL